MEFPKNYAKIRILDIFVILELWCHTMLHSNTPSAILLYIVTYCHNPSNNPKQLKTTFVGLVLLSVRKTTTPRRHYNSSHFKGT